jgi:hypothetical protein
MYLSQNGGNGKFLGGGPDKNLSDVIADILEYEKSPEHQSKAVLIRGILNTLKVMKLDVNPFDTDPSRALARAIDLLDGKSIDNKSGAQSAVCKSLGKFINEHSEDIKIDLSKPDAAICSEVVRALKKLMENINAESKNLVDLFNKFQLLDQLKDYIQALKYIKKKINERLVLDEKHMSSENIKVLNANNEVISEVIKGLDDVYNNLMTIQTNGLPSVLKDVVKAQADIDNTYDFMRKFSEERPGTSGHAKNVMSIVSRTLGAVYSIQELDSILKKLNMTLNDYINHVESRDLKQVLDKIVNDHLSDEEVLKAVDDIRNFTSTISVTNLKDLTKGGCDSCSGDGAIGGGYSSGGYDSTTDSMGPYKTVNTERENEYTRKTEVRKSALAVQMDVFNRALGAIIDKIYTSVNAIASQLGDSIPLSEDLDGLRQMLLAVDDIKNGDVYLTLSGFYISPEARKVREQYLDKCRRVVNYLDKLSAMSIYSGARTQFGNLKDNFLQMIKLIDEWSDKYNKTTGGAIYGDDIKKEIARRVGTMSKSTYKLTNAIDRFDYFYRIASIKENLKSAQSEIKSYGENYNTILGNAVANKVKELQAQYEALIKEIDSDDWEQDNAIHPAVAPNAAGKVKGCIGAYAAKLAEYKNAIVHSRGSGQTVLVSNELAEIKKSLKSFFKDQYDTTVKMYRALEAIDLYMKEFAEAITKHPEVVKDIKSMFDDLEANIADWFSDKTGNLICKAFEEFPHRLDAVKYDTVAKTFAAANPTNNFNDADYTESTEKIGGANFAAPEFTGNKDHYYKYVEGLIKQNGAVIQSGHSV